VAVLPEPVQQAVAAGFSVVPADADKHPRVKAWKPWQTTRQTPEEVAALGHGSIWGLVTGALYGVTVLDFDGPEGERTLAKLGPAPHVKTPGGFHLYVRHPGYPVKNSARAFEQYPGMDVRGDGGLAWFAGRSRKGVYEPLIWPPVPIELPPELAEELFPHPQAAGPQAPRSSWDGPGVGGEAALRLLGWAADQVLDAKPGTSNEVLNKMGLTVGGLVAAGQLSRDHAFAVLLEAAEQRGAGDPANVLRSSMAAGEERPWAIEVGDAEYVPAFAYKMFRRGAVPEPTPFPVEVLPSPLDDFVLQGADSISCPVDFLGAGLLPVIGAAIGGYVDLRLTETWKESAGVYTMLVGPPGSRKTPAINLLMAPAWEAERSLRTAYQAEIQDAADWKEIRPPRLVVDDATIEALFGILEKNERGVILAADELTGWVQGMNQYKGGNGRDRQHWLSIWSRRPIPVDRKKSTSHFIDRPFVTILGGIQPEPLEGLLAGKDDGLLPRLLMARGEFIVPRFRLGAIDPETMNGYARVWNRVRDEGILAETVEFTPDGIRAYETWVNDHYKTLTRVPPELAGAWAKMDGQAGRIILILARILGTHATEDVVDRAVALVRYFQGQAATLLGASTSATPWEKTQAAREKVIARYLGDHPGATRGDVMAMGPEWAMDMRTVDRLLESLRAKGLEVPE
jgi:hypothetical protein